MLVVLMLEVVVILEVLPVVAVVLGPVLECLVVVALVVLIEQTLN